MKKIIYLLSGVSLFFFASCKKYLDINSNPNDATTSTPELVLPQAITTSGSVTSSYNSYGAALAGYTANGGGYSGFGSYISYDFTTGNYASLWADTYDNLQDYSFVIKKSTGVVQYNYYNAVARIMTAYGFQLLVDTYNDLPYKEAFQGAANLRPKYDKAEDVYKDIAAQIDTAITLINDGIANETDQIKKPIPLTSLTDPLFSRISTAGNAHLINWKKFANTIKLRLIVRSNGKVAFNNTTFSPEGFITADALVNPGYAKQSGKQNPAWNTWAYSYTGSSSGSSGLSRLPSIYILTFYDKKKITDDKRAAVVFKTYPNTPRNQLGNETNPTPTTTATSNPIVPKQAAPSAWYKGTNATTYTKVGIFKGFDAAAPLILATESYFLQAEAALKGIITGNAQALYTSGIDASFNYLYQDNTNLIPAAPSPYSAPATDAAAYRTANAGNKLVDYTAAANDAERLEAIITQKYIALNMICSHEPWNDYRRTGYPKVVAGSTDPELSFASITSISPRADKLPTRVLYPASEFSNNSANVPKNIDKFASLIFWAK